MIHSSLADSTHKTYETGVAKFNEFCREYKQVEEVNENVLTEDTLELWLSWLVEKYHTPISTLNTYLSGLKRAVAEGRMASEGEEIFNGHRILSILKGVARTHVKGTTEKELNRSISAPFTIDNFISLSAHLSATPRGTKKLYGDILCLAVMGMGLGGALRPGEYLTTNEVQRQEAILTFSAVSLNIRIPPTTAIRYISPIEFLNSHRRSYTNKGIRVESISINLKCSKTDQTHLGSVVIIDNPICISHIMDYLLICPTPLPAHSPFFLNREGIALTALSATNMARSIMFHCDFPSPSDFSLKSLRSGAVQTLVNNNGGEMEIAALGRWTSGQTPRQHYIRTAPSAYHRSSFPTSTPPPSSSSPASSSSASSSSSSSSSSSPSSSPLVPYSRPA